MAFDPKAHLTQIKGKDYLEVKWRLVWFRDEHADWSIQTKPIEIGEAHAIFFAKIVDDQGRVVATGTKKETRQGFADFVEKAETGAVGRALAMSGYGTQFAPELEEGDRLADAPVEKRKNGVALATPSHENNSTASPAQIKKINVMLTKITGTNTEKRDEFKRWMYGKFNVSSTTELSKQQASTIIEALAKKEAVQVETEIH